MDGKNACHRLTQIDCGGITLEDLSSVGNYSVYRRFSTLASYQRILVRLYARVFSLWVTTTELVGASLNKDSWMSFTGYAMNFFRCPVKSWWLHYMTRNLEKTRQKRNLAIWVHYAYAWSKALLPLDSRDQVTNFRCPDSRSIRAADWS